MRTRKNIDDVDVGTYVTDGNGCYGIVLKCCHGNKYYGNRDAVDVVDVDVDDIINVYDMDTDELTCCT